MKRRNNFKKSMRQNNINNNPDDIMSRTFYNSNRNPFYLRPSSRPINFNLKLTTGQTYHVRGNSNETFQSILNKFINDNNLVQMKDKITSAILEANVIKFDKTLSESQINEGSTVLLIIQNDEKNNNNKDISLTDSISTEASFSDLLTRLDELNEIFILTLYLHYVTKKMKNSYQILMKVKGRNLCNGIRECSHIHTYKHIHGLVLLYSNNNWTCDICNMFHFKNDSTYHCSLCNFYACKRCIGLQKKYNITESYHQQTQLLNFKFPCHEHKMIYCRTSRARNKESSWVCDLCLRMYENKIWSFYCTKCDYDICLSCSKKYLPSFKFINKIGIKIDNHCHDLVCMITNRNWICDLCMESYPSFLPTFYCSKCDYDVCKRCMDKLSDEKKYPLINSGERISYKYKNIINHRHPHQLIYCITSRSSIGETNWICNNCMKNYNNNEWSFYCTLCDYDLCYDCYIFNLNKY